MPIRRVACLLVGCKPVKVAFSGYRAAATLAGLSGSCVTPTLHRCERCGQVQVID